MLAGLRVPSTLRAKPVRMTPAIGSAKRGESWARSETSPTLPDALPSQERTLGWLDAHCSQVGDVLTRSRLKPGCGPIFTQGSALFCLTFPQYTCPTRTRASSAVWVSGSNGLIVTI